MRKIIFILTVISFVSADLNAQMRSRTVMFANKSQSSVEAAQNKLLWAQVQTNAVYGVNNITITDDQALDMEGNNTLDMIDCTSAVSNYYGQTLTVLPSTTYYFKMDVKLGTATSCYWGIRDQSNFNDLVAPTNTGATTTLQRLTFSFTTTASTTSITVHPYYNTPSTGTVYIGRVQLALTSTAPYAVTTTTAVN